MIHAISGLMLATASSLVPSIVAKVTVTAALALIGAWLARRSRAAVRHALLAAAFGVMMLLPVASLVAPPVGIAVPVAAQAGIVPAPPAAAFQAVPPIASPSAEVRAAPRARPGAALPPSSAWFAAWFAGAVFSLLRVAMGLREIRSLRRSGVPWLHGQSLARELAFDTGVHRRIEVLLSEALSGPMTCGAVHPAIVLPLDAQRWQEEDLKRALVHELEHVRRGDSATHCLTRAVCALYWFHPLVWMAWRRLALEAERSCDDAVLRRSEAADYADQLVALARKLSAAARPPLLAMANRADLSVRVGAVLDARQRRGRAGAFLVALACAAAAVAVVAVSPLRTVAAQQPAPAQPVPPPEFEAVSIKPFPVGAAMVVMSGCDGGPGTDKPGSFVCEYTTPRFLLMKAYEVRDAEIFGPGWLDSEYFNIVAKLPQGATKEKVAAMLRALLAERFKLAVHHEERAMPVLALTVAKSGLKIKESTPPPAASDGAKPAGPPPRGEDGFPILRPDVLAGGPTILYRPGRSRLQAGNTTLAQLASALSSQMGQVVIDETGLDGKYDITLNWTPGPAEMGASPGPGTGVPQEASAPGTSLFAALEQQLGLKLVTKKIARDVIVVDSGEKVPTAN